MRTGGSVQGSALNTAWYIVRARDVSTCDGDDDDVLFILSLHPMISLKILSRKLEAKFIFLNLSSGPGDICQLVYITSLVILRVVSYKNK